MHQIKRLFDIPGHQFTNYPNNGMFVSKIDGIWQPMSTAHFIERTLALSKGLVKLGVHPGERVAIVSSNRVEWNLMDIAIQQIGGIVVPLYPNISTSDYCHILTDASIRFAFVGTHDLYVKLTSIIDRVPTLERVMSFDANGEDSYEQLFALGQDITTTHINELKANVRSEDLATIIYTSGTTGNPKGVMLSHTNLISNVLACVYSIPANEHSKVLTFLPMCHVYERMLHYLYMYVGASIHFAESMDTIGDNIREVKPEIFTAVPRLIEKVFDRIMAKGDEQRGIKRMLFFWAVKVAESYNEIESTFWYRIKLGIARKLIFSKWKEALGGNVRAIASGSAALQPRLAQIFMAAGIPILEGYGLTETSPVISVNCLKRGIRIGTVGPLIEGVKVRIAEDGEILVKGPNVMMGYYNLPDKTAEVLDPHGWFHTGDIGVMIEDKYLKITDRKKEIFKTSGGKYIIPQMMENKFKESRFIEQIIVLGESRRFPSALIVPCFTFIKDWAKRKQQNDLEALTPEQLINHPDVVAKLEEEVAAMNEQFGNWEKIKKFALLPHELTIDGGELTPTLKLKRKFILEKYASLIEPMYEGAHHEEEH